MAKMQNLAQKLDRLAERGARWIYLSALRDVFKDAGREVWPLMAAAPALYALTNAARVGNWMGGAGTALARRSFGLAASISFSGLSRWAPSVLLAKQA